ncbi:MAG: AEC family transporter [Rhodospirillaceae bacterium]|nr:AEC family transporter [Rhodospirillaceae bacterium]
MLLRLIEVILPVLICAGIGYGWARTGRPFDTRMVTRLVTNIGTPCLIVATLTGLRLESDAFWTMTGAAFLSIFVFFVIAFALTRLTGDDFRTYGPPLGFANAGNLGLPLCLFAFGEPGLALAIAYFAVGAVGQFTVGQFIVAGRFSLKTAVLSPVIWAIGLALALNSLDWPMPRALANAFELLGGFAIPLMLIAMGVSLASLRVSGLGKSLFYAVVRIAIGVAIGLGMGAALGLPDLARGVLLIQCAMPAAVFNYLWASYYERNPEAVAGVVFVSTLLAFAVLPVIVAVAIDPGLLPWR